MFPCPVTLEGRGVRLEPLNAGHAESLARAAAEGHLWQLWFTGVPEFATVSSYMEAALDGSSEQWRR